MKLGPWNHSDEAPEDFGARWVVELATNATVQVAVVAPNRLLLHALMAPAILHQCPAVRWFRAQSRIVFPNGAAAHLYDGEDLCALRGTLHHAAWLSPADQLGYRIQREVYQTVRRGETRRVLLTGGVIGNAMWMEFDPALVAV